MMRTGEPIETHPSSLKREGYLLEREGFPLPWLVTSCPGVDRSAFLSVCLRLSVSICLSN